MRWALISSLAVMAGCSGGSASGRPEVMVYAAVSLREPLQRIAPSCEAFAGAGLVLNFGASNDLARQVESGGRADVFISADEATMDRLAAAGLVDAVSRRSLLSNHLVVVAPADEAVGEAVLHQAADLAGPSVRRLSLADPDAVPAGKYAKAWLQRTGLWDAVKDRVVPALDARAALAAVESGAAQAGVVYRTDAALSSRVTIRYEIGEDEGPAISYSIAAMNGRPRPELSLRVLECLEGPTAAELFRRAGFIVKTAP